jgi:cytochrome c oxidase subunit IV
MFYERLALTCAILVPTSFLAVLIGLMWLEANNTNATRSTFLDEGSSVMVMEGASAH